jgi:hypothetical protein
VKAVVQKSGLGSYSKESRKKETTIVCGNAVRWWDGDIKDIRLKRQVSKKIIGGRKDRRGENYKLHSEIKKLVRKKLDS